MWIGGGGACKRYIDIPCFFGKGLLMSRFPTMLQLFQAYGAHRHKDHHRLIFVFDGMAVKGNSTPAEVNRNSSLMAL